MLTARILWQEISALAMVSYPLVTSIGQPKRVEKIFKLFHLTPAALGLVTVTAGTGLVVAVVLRAKDDILKLVGTAVSLCAIAVSQFILSTELRASTFST